MEKELNIISLGAGVQSSTMALMAAHGELTPQPDYAIFADTQWEPPHVYEYLELLENKLPFPVLRVTNGSLREKILTEGYSDVPWHTSTGMGRRQCTFQFKIRPLQKAVKKIAGVKHGGQLKAGAIKMWIGISTDEAVRMKPSHVKYIKNTWPLIDKRMSRRDCISWLEGCGLSLPQRSACIACPFKSDAEWRDTKNDHKLWSEALFIDNEIRKLGGGKENQFVHRSCNPLGDVDLDTLEDKGQLNMFENECEGYCGV